MIFSRTTAEMGNPKDDNFLERATISGPERSRPSEVRGVELEDDDLGQNSRGLVENGSHPGHAHHVTIDPTDVSHVLNKKPALALHSLNGAKEMRSIKIRAVYLVP